MQTMYLNSIGNLMYLVSVAKVYPFLISRPKINGTPKTFLPIENKKKQIGTGTKKQITILQQNQITENESNKNSER